MKDKTLMYVLIIFGIVAMVAIVNTIVNSDSNAAPNENAEIDFGSSITGNVVSDGNDSQPVDLRGVGRFIFGAVLIGISAYMYIRYE